MKEWILTSRPETWIGSGDLRQMDWCDIPALPPFILADGSREANLQTTVRPCCTSQFLVVRFDCQDRDIWGNYTRRDDPIYNEEAVEMFIAPNTADPIDYYEFEISPNGVLFDARIHNPDGRNNRQMTGDVAWNCPGVRWEAGRDDLQQHWWATLAIPWQSVTTSVELPKAWRANFYRIERPQNQAAEFSCWSPVMTPVPDFHRPAQFGFLYMNQDNLSL